MRILASAGKQQSPENNAEAGADDDKASCDEDASGPDEVKTTKQETTEKQERTEQQDANEQQDDLDEADEELPTTDELTGILNSLTGIPLPEDVLLYGVPVCAPYSTMTNYKFKACLVCVQCLRKIIFYAPPMYHSIVPLSRRCRPLVRPV